MGEHERIEQAERAIAAVLAQLEKDVGMFVVGLKIHDVETTQLSSPRRVIHRRVEVELLRAPGTYWSI